MMGEYKTASLLQASENVKRTMEILSDALMEDTGDSGSMIMGSVVHGESARTSGDASKTSDKTKRSSLRHRTSLNSSLFKDAYGKEEKPVIENDAVKPETKTEVASEPYKKAYKRRESTPKHGSEISYAQMKKNSTEKKNRRAAEAIACGDAPKELCSVEKWREFSMTPQKESDIENMLINEPNNICMTYVCRYSRLSEEFIERLIALTSGVICGVTTEEQIKNLQDAMIEYMLSDDEDFEGRAVDITMCNKQTDWEVKTVSVKPEDVRDKLDWKYISIYQKLSEDFVFRWLKYLDTRLVLNNQKLSSRTIESLKQLLKFEVEKRKQELEEAAKDDIIASYMVDRATEDGYDDIED